MVIENDPLTFLQWLPGGLLTFAIRTALIALFFLIVGYLVAAVRYGPMEAGDRAYKVFATGVKDLFFTSPRRVWALARLAIQESIRRRVIVVLIVFVLILGFARWFLDVESHDPAKLYLSFVLTSTNFLVLSMALFLATFSLPTDIKNRTIYTIVTKPVRAGEIVLGRMIGFVVVGTVLLAVMGLGSYVFVVRGLSHTHDVSVYELSEVTGPDGPIGKRGKTEPSMNHRHAASIDLDGTGQTDSNLGHWHAASPIEEGGDIEAVTGPPRGMLQARVPIYGKLRFRDRTGNEVARGISVGNEWAYRSFIEGESQAAAIWTFEEIDRDAFPKGLPIEMYIRVFRTYKGDIEKGILGSIRLRNPETGLTSEPETFRAKDFYIDERLIPVELRSSKGDKIDLFDDLVHEGKIQIEMACEERAQYFGMAQADLYLRARDASFFWNFVKGYSGIWVQMVLVTVLGVVFSTFLSGPVAMMATLGSIILGLSSQFIMSIVQGVRGDEGGLEGGGPVEALWRTVTQMNMTTELEPSPFVTVVQTIDRILSLFMDAVVHTLPDFGSYSNVDRVAYGFNIPIDIVLQNLVAGLGYLLCGFVAGYFFLRVRELAR